MYIQLNKPTLTQSDLYGLRLDSVNKALQPNLCTSLSPTIIET